MSTAPQLQLSIQPSTTSFKRSFEQFGVDLGSPVGPSDTDVSTTNPHNGNDRNKRARNSITNISEENTASSSSLIDTRSTDSQSSSSSSSFASLSSATDDETAQVLGLTEDSTPVISLRASVIPPRLPTPDIQGVDMSDYHHQGTESVEPANTSTPIASLLPLDLPAQHVQPSTSASSSTANSSAASRTQSDTQAQYRLSLERFNAFDTEIAFLRLPATAPVPLSRNRLQRRTPTPPPILPPITLAAEQESFATFLDDSPADTRPDSSPNPMDRRVRYQPDRLAYRPLQLHQSREDDEDEEAEGENDEGGSDSDSPPNRVQSRIHEAFREHLDSALERLRSGSPLVPNLEGERDGDEDEGPASTIAPHPPILPPLVMDVLERLLDDPELQQPPRESTSQERSDSGTITPRVASTSTPTIRTISNPSLVDHPLPSPLLRELHNWMDEDDIQEGPSTATEFLVGPFSSSSMPSSRYVSLPQLDVGGGLDLGLEESAGETSHRVGQSNSHTPSRTFREAQPSSSSAVPYEVLRDLDRFRPRPSRHFLPTRTNTDAETSTSLGTSSSLHNFRHRLQRFQSSTSLVSEALAEARARLEMEDIRPNRHTRAFRDQPSHVASTRETWRSRALSLRRELELPLFPPAEESYFEGVDLLTSRRSQDQNRRTGRRSSERRREQEREQERERDFETEIEMEMELMRNNAREFERGIGSGRNWIALGLRSFEDPWTTRSGHSQRPESRQRVAEASGSRSASNIRTGGTPSATGRDEERDNRNEDSSSAAQSRDSVSISADFRTELSMLRETMAGLTRTLETAVGASASHSSNMPESSRSSQPQARRATGGLPTQDRSEADTYHRRRARANRNNITAERRRHNASPPRRPSSPYDGGSFYDLLNMIGDTVAAVGNPSRNMLGLGGTFEGSAVGGEGADEEHASRDRQASPSSGGRSARGIVISDLDSHNGDSRMELNIALGVGAAPAAPSTRTSHSSSMSSRPHRFSWMGTRRRERSLTDLLSGILPSSPTSPSSAISHSPLTSSSTSLHLPASSFLDEPLRRHRLLTEEDESDMDVDYEMGMDTMDTSASFDRPSLPAISQPSLHERGPFNSSFPRLSDSGFGLRSPPSPIEFRRSHSFGGEDAEENGHDTLENSVGGIGSTEVSHSHHAHNHNHPQQQQQHVASASPPQPPSLPPPDLGRPLSPTHLSSSVNNSYRILDEPERAEMSRNGIPNGIHTSSNPYARVPMDSAFAYQNLSTPPLPPASTLVNMGMSFYVAEPVQPPLPAPHTSAEIYDGRESHDSSNPDSLRYRTRTIPVPRHPQYMADIPGPTNPARMTDSPFLRNERLPLPPRPTPSSWHRSQNTRPTLPSVFGNAPVDPSRLAPGPFRNTVEHMMTERGLLPSQVGTRYDPQTPSIPPIVFDNSYDTPSRNRVDDTPASSSSGHSRSNSGTDSVDRLGSLRRSINEFEHRIFHRPPLTSTSTNSSFASARGAALLNQEANNSASNLHNYVHLHPYHHHPHNNSNTTHNQQQPTTNSSWSDSTSNVRPSPSSSSPRRYPRPYTSSASDMHRLLTERVRTDGSRLEGLAQPPPYVARLHLPTELSGALRNHPVPSLEEIPWRAESGLDPWQQSQPPATTDRYRRTYEAPGMAPGSYLDRLHEQRGGGSGVNGSQRTGEDMNRETVTPRSTSRWLSGGSGSDDSLSINTGDSSIGDLMTAMRGRRARFSRPDGIPLFGRRRSRQALGDYMHDDEFDASYENLLNLAATLGDVRAKSTPEDIINTQETATYKDWATTESDQRCPICLDDYQQEDTVLKLSNCSHWLHRDCLKQWLQTANTCPVCRKRVDVPAADSSSSSRPRTRRRLSYGTSIHRGFSALRRASDPPQASGPSTSASGASGSNHNQTSSNNSGATQPSHITVATPRSQERSSSPPGTSRLLLRRDSTGFSAFHRFFETP